MEQELIRVERLRALGELAVGVSHNLNNLLTGVLGHAQFLQRATDDPKLLREVNGILTSGWHARDVVRRLSQSVRGEEAEESLHAVPVNEGVQAAVQAAQPRWQTEAQAQGIPIDVIAELGEVPPIRGTESGLHTVLLNLLFNAVDAMPEGGTITLRTQWDKAGVQLSVSDTGIGMDAETCRRVFEPFFTTKQTVDAGLGLSASYGTVPGWGGNIEVESTPGTGTTFTLHLPIWTQPSDELHL